MAELDPGLWAKEKSIHFPYKIKLYRVGPRSVPEMLCKWAMPFPIKIYGEVGSLGLLRYDRWLQGIHKYGKVDLRLGKGRPDTARYKARKKEEAWP